MLNDTQPSFDPTDLAQARFERDQQLKINSGGFGSTKGAEALINKFIDEAVTEVTKELQVLKRTRTKSLKMLWTNIGVLDPKSIAVVGLHHMLSAIGSCMSLGKTAMIVGRGIEYEAFSFTFKSVDEKVAARVEAFVRKKNSSLKHRRTALRAIATKQGMTTSKWDHQTLLTAGEWLVGVLLRVPLFTLVSERGQGKASYITLTEEAFRYQESFVQRIIAEHPVFAPIKVRPQPWVGVKGSIVTHGKTFGIRLIRTRNRSLTDALVKQAITDGKMVGVLKALNTIQDTTWAINSSILEMVEWAYETGVKIEGLPSKDDIDPPEKGVWEDMTEDQRKVWRKSAETVAILNRSLNGQRTTVKTDITTAKYLSGDPFWTPVNMDYRGRVYHLSHFNFQRGDYVRGMFQFAEGRRLGERGFYWLKVHLANCGDFQKISKAGFDDRVAWVDRHMVRLTAMVAQPKDDLWWTEADSPFLFLAAARDVVFATLHGITQDVGTYVSHIPVSFDGSCSGLQHLCAMTKAPEGILVNLGPTERVNDIYQVVADREAEALKKESDPEKQPMAQMALAFGVNRSFVKRQVMTYAYSSPVGGMREQIKQDYMIPLHYKVLSGELKEHPFGEEWHKSAQYLASVVYKSIEETVHYPAQAMKFLQRIAGTMAHEGKHLVWTTPLGLPVVLKYAQQEEVSHVMYLSDLNVRFSVLLNEDTKGIDKSSMRSAIAPCFVHSYDACHLMMVVNASATKDLALVHDSFGCHAGEAQAFRRVLTDTFVDLYTNSDPLDAILREAHEQIDTNSHRMPQKPTYGSLMIKDIANADYAFA